MQTKTEQKEIKKRVGRAVYFYEIHEDGVDEGAPLAEIPVRALYIEESPEVLGRFYLHLRELVSLAVNDNDKAVRNYCDKVRKASATVARYKDGREVYVCAVDFFNDLRLNLERYVPKFYNSRHEHGLRDLCDERDVVIKAVRELSFKFKDEPHTETPLEHENVLNELKSGKTGDNLLAEIVAKLENTEIQVERILAALDLVDFKTIAKINTMSERVSVATSIANDAQAKLADLEKEPPKEVLTDHEKAGAFFERVFTNPKFLLFPLVLAIIASFVHIGLTFAEHFESTVGFWFMSAVFASVVLVFTFNGRTDNGKFFAVLFAIIEGLINAVYFGLIPDGTLVVQLCAAFGLPLSILAYTYLFTDYTKKARK